MTSQMSGNTHTHTPPIKYIASKYVKNLKDVHDTAQSSVKKKNQINKCAKWVLDQPETSTTKHDSYIASHKTGNN